MVDQLNPLLTDKRVTSVIRDLPKGLRLIATIIETLSQSEVKSKIENGLPLKEILRDSGEKNLNQLLNKILQNKSNKIIKILVKSNLNIVKLSLMSEKVSTPFKEAICDPKLLGEYLILNNSLDLQEISNSLCPLDISELQSLLHLIQDELDFVKILSQLSNIMPHVGLNYLPEHIQNIQNMIKIIKKTNIFTSINVLLNSSWINSVPFLTDIINELEYRLNYEKNASFFSLIQLAKADNLDAMIEKLIKIIEKLQMEPNAEPALVIFQQIYNGLVSLKELDSKELFEIKCEHSLLINDIFNFISFEFRPI